MPAELAAPPRQPHEAQNPSTAKITTPVRIFVPRWMDSFNTNAQNSNARALLSRFSDQRARWTAVCADEVAGPICDNELVDVRRISASRFWYCKLAIAYQPEFDAIFYPGVHWADRLALSARNLVRRHIPVIATIEGIIACPDSLQRLSSVVGHPVFSQLGADASVGRIRSLYHTADHIIAISPFLARIAEALYGEKVSCVPLGIETQIFHARGRREPARARVVGCGTVKNSKSPQLFVQLAERYKNADFIWFGDGQTRQLLLAETRRLGLANLDFPGAISPESLAEEFRRSSLFVLPSHAEGVPKVTQEAAACGLPVALHGFYEAPTVIHEINGLVSWSDGELLNNVGALLDDWRTRSVMGQRGAEMAKGWDWDLIAPEWEELLIRVAAS